MGKELCETSLVVQVVATVSAAAKTSGTARALGRLGAALSALGRGTWAARIVQVDWGAQKWLAESQLAQAVQRIGQKLEKVGQAGAKRLHAAWTASHIGGMVCSQAQVNTRGVRFWAGLLLGFGLGILVFGRLAGTLTDRRLVAAVILGLMGGLVMIWPGNLKLWIDDSRFVQWTRYVLNLGAGPK